STLRLVDSERECESELGLHSSTQKELESGLQSLLSKTARQFQVTKHIIKTLGKTDVQWAAQLARNLNTRDRRDRALQTVIESRCKSTLTAEEAVCLLDLQSTMSDGHSAHDALLKILYAMAADNAPPMPNIDTSRLLKAIDRIHRAKQRCRAYSLLIAI